MTVPRLRMTGTIGAGMRGAFRVGPVPGPRSGAVVPQACSGWQQFACAAAVTACGATCLLGPEACLPCLQAVGAANCLDCLLGN